MKCPACSYEPVERPKVFCPSCGAMFPRVKPPKAAAAPKVTKKKATKKKSSKK